MTEQERLDYITGLADELWPGKFDNKIDKFNAVAKEYNLPSFDETDKNKTTKLSEDDDGLYKPFEYKINTDYLQEADLSIADYLALNLEKSEQPFLKYLSDLGKLGFSGSVAGSMYAQDSGYEKYNIEDLESWKGSHPNFLEHGAAWMLGMLSGPDMLHLWALPQMGGTAARMASQRLIANKLFQKGKVSAINRLKREGSAKGLKAVEWMIDNSPGLAQRSTTFGIFGFQSTYHRELAEQKMRAVQEGDPDRPFDRWTAIKKGGMSFLEEGAVGAVLFGNDLWIEGALGKIAMIKKPKFRHRVKTVMLDLGKRPLEAGEMATMHSLYNYLEKDKWFTPQEWGAAFGTNLFIIETLKSREIKQTFTNLRNRLKAMKDAEFDNSRRILETYNELESDFKDIGDILELKDFKNEYLKKHSDSKTDAEAIDFVLEMVNETIQNINSADFKQISPKNYNALLLGREYLSDFIKNINKQTPNLNKQRAKEGKKPLTEKDIANLKDLTQNDLDQIDLILKKISDYTNTNDPNVLKDIKLDEAKANLEGRIKYILRKDPDFEANGYNKKTGELDKGADIFKIEAQIDGWERQKGKIIEMELEAEIRTEEIRQANIWEQADPVQREILTQIKKIQEGKVNLSDDIKKVPDIKKVKTPLVSEVDKSEIVGTIQSTGKTIRESLVSAKLNEKNRKIATYGIQKYMAKNKATPVQYSRVLEFFEFLQKKGISVDKATNDLFTKFMKSKGLSFGDPLREQYGMAITKFYGAGTRSGAGVELKGRTTGFAHDYMVKGQGVNAYIERIADPGTYGAAAKGQIIDPKKVTRILPGEKGWDKVRNKIDKNIETKENVENVNPSVVKVLMDVFYNFGNRGVDLFKHEGLLIQNINWSTGVIGKWKRSTKATGMDTKYQYMIPIKTLFPKLWDAMVKARGNRGSGDLLVDNNNKRITLAKFNKILDKIIPDDIQIEAGGKGKFGLQDFRRMIERDALEIAGKEGMDPNQLMLMVNNWLTGRAPKGVQQLYLGAHQSLHPKFAELRKTHTSELPFETILEARKARAIEKQDIEGPPKPPELKRKTVLKKEKEKQSKKTSDEILDETKVSDDSKISMVKILQEGGNKYKEEAVWKNYVFQASKKIEKLKFDFEGDKESQIKELRKWAKLNLAKELFNKKIGDLDLVKELYKDAVKYSENVLAETLNLGNIVRKKFYSLAEKGFKLKSNDDKLALRNKIAMMAKIPDPYNFSWSNAAIEGVKTTEGHLLSFLFRVDQVRESKGVQKTLKRSVAVWDRVSAVEDFIKMATREGNPIDTKVAEGMMKVLGIPKNNLYLAEEGQLNRFISMLQREGFDYERGASFFEVEELQNIGKKTDKQIKNDIKFYEGIGRLGTTVSEVIRKHLGDENAKRFFAHASKEVDYVGKMAINETKLMRILGGTITKTKVGKDTKYEIIGQDYAEVSPATAGRRYFNKIKDVFQYNDKSKREGYLKLKINGKLAIPKELRSFIKKAFTKDGHYRKDTVEGHAMRQFNEHMKDFRKNLEEILRVVLPPNKAKEIIDNIKWVDEYAYKEVSEAYLEHFDADHEPSRRALIEVAEKEALKLAIKKYGQKPTEEQMREFFGEGWDRANIKAIQARRFGGGRLDIHSMKSRVDNFDLKYKSVIDGKEHATYNLDKWYDTSYKKYVFSMSKHLANLEYFPEVMNMTGKAFKDYRVVVNELMTKTKTAKKEVKQVRNYLIKVIERRLGVGEDARPLYGGENWLGTVANVHARTVLSGPLKGLKNNLIGNPMSTLSFGTANFMLSIGQAFRGFNRDMVKAGGHTEIGMKDYQLPVKQGTNKFFNKVTEWADKGAKAAFWTGFMKPSENLNRYTAVLSSLIEQRMLGESLQFGDEKSKIQAERRFSEFYEATGKEIDMIKRLGLVNTDSIDWSKITNPRERIRLEREYNNMRQKFNFMAHSRTHGASMDIFLPKFAEHRIAKPMLLFRRMGFLATTNTNRGMREAINDRAYHKVFGYLGFNLLGGATRAAIIYNFLGAPMPDENGPWWKQLKMYAWLNEVGGIFSEILSPYIGRESIATSFTPFILENLNQAVHLTASVVPTYWREKAFVGKAIRGAQYATGFWQGTAWDDTAEQTYKFWTAADIYLRKTVGLYNDLLKDFDYRQNPFNSKWKQADQWYFDWLKSEGKSKSGNFARTEQNMYYRELKSSFLKGNKEEFSRMFSTLTYHMFQSYLSDWRDEELAWKKTTQQMKRYMKMLSPIRASAETNDYIVPRRTQYLASLPRNKRIELVKFENSYKYRLKEYINYMNNFWESYRIDDIKSRYNFTKKSINDLLK